MALFNKLGGMFTDNPVNKVGPTGQPLMGGSNITDLLTRSAGGLLGREVRGRPEQLTAALAQIDPKAPDAQEQQLTILAQLGNPQQQIMAAQKIKANREKVEEKEDSIDKVANMVATRFKDNESVSELISLAGQGVSFKDIVTVANEKDTSSLSAADRFKVVKGSVFDVLEQKFIASPDNLSEGAKRTQVIKGINDEGEEVSKLINLNDGSLIETYLVPKDEVGSSATALRINEKLYRDAEDYEKRARSADRVLTKLSDLEGRVAAGAFNTLEEGFKKLTGRQDDVSMLRMEAQRLISSSAIANLPRGPASDADIALVLRGELDSNAGPKAIADYARGIKKIAEFAARQSRDKLSWLDRFGDLRGFNSQQLLNRYKQEIANISNVEQSKIPQDAVQRLLENKDKPGVREEFTKVYGVDYIGILENKERAEETLLKLDRSF